MKRVDATGVGFIRETPAFTFQATLHDGKDFDGKFKIAFAAIETGGERRLAVVKGTQQDILASLGNEDSLRVITAMLDQGEYIVCINYENSEYEIPPDTVAVPILGRVTGEEFDWVERTPLPEEHGKALREIREVLANG
jgi:hypothetical protein